MPFLLEKKWAVTLPETKDESFSYFTQCAHLSEQPTCLRSNTCPCSCLTAQPVFNEHSVPCSSFRFAVAHIFFIRQVYRERRCCALTIASQSLTCTTAARCRVCFLPPQATTSTVTTMTPLVAIGHSKPLLPVPQGSKHWKV